MSSLGFRGTIRFKKRLEVKNLKGFRLGSMAKIYNKTLESIDSGDEFDIKPNNADTDIEKGIITDYYLRLLSSINSNNIATVTCIIPRESMQKLFRYNFIEIIDEKE
jgi:hypothetical protein